MLERSGKAQIDNIEDGSAKKTLRIKYTLPVPLGLTFDRSKRCAEVKPLPITIYLSLYSHVKRIDLEIELDNQMRDHRIRMLFPTGMNAEKVQVDGHFYVLDRPVQLPKGENWHQPPSKTNHQNKFISISEQSHGITICNRGLPEYEVIETDAGLVLAVTLLRCVGWLALPFMKTRQKEPAGPDFSTPEAQCLGPHKFHLAIVTHSDNFLNRGSFVQANQFHSPLKSFNPAVMRTALRIPDHIFFKGLPIHLPSDYTGPKFLPERLSFLNLEPQDLLLSTCKRAENEEALILRVYNLADTLTNGKITLFREIEQVETVNFEESPKTDPQITELSVQDNSFEFRIPSAKIATFRVVLKAKS
jgi:alpha-mannosidase